MNTPCSISRPLRTERNAIYPATLVGRPPQEDAYLGKATERIFLPLLQTVAPDILDMDMPVEGVFHNNVIVKIRKRYAGHGKKVIHTIWGTGMLMLSKFVVVCDEDVDIHDYSEVTWKVMNHVDPQRDVVITDGPLDILDHSCPQIGFGGKMGIDATRKGPGEGSPGRGPTRSRWTRQSNSSSRRVGRNTGFNGRMVNFKL